MKAYLIGKPVHFVVSKIAKEATMKAAGSVSKKYTAVTLEDSLVLSFKELGQKAANGEQISSFKAIIRGMGLRAKGLGQVIMAPFKKAYNYIKGFFSKSETAAAEGAQTNAGAAATTAPATTPTN